MVLNLIKSENALVNTIMFPGGITKSTYTIDSFQESFNLRLLYLPFLGSVCNSFAYCLAAPSSIPVLLATNPSPKTNAIAICAQREAQAFKAHYLLVEYPGYGISDGYPNEVVIDQVAESVAQFVMHTLHVSASDIILTGRSIGTGPAVRLAASLQASGHCVRAVILQSPFASIRATTGDLLGDATASCLCDRWQSWRHLVGSSSRSVEEVIACPVLFIHADGDQIIPVRHSVYMHRHRAERGLPSELFIQQSNERYIKGHNFFDYEKDVVLPAREFLLKHTREGERRPLVLPRDAIEQCTAVPREYRDRHDALLARRESERHKEGLLSSQAMARDNVEREREERERDAALMPSKWTPSAVLGVACCPCVFCVEGNLACCFNATQRCVQYVVNDEKEFDYVALKNRDLQIERLKEKEKKRKEQEEARLSGSGSAAVAAQGEGHPFSSWFAVFRRGKEIPVEHLLDERKVEVANPIVAAAAQQQNTPPEPSHTTQQAAVEKLKRRQVSITLTEKEIEQMGDSGKPASAARSDDCVYIPG